MTSFFMRAAPQPQLRIFDSPEYSRVPSTSLSPQHGLVIEVALEHDGRGGRIDLRLALLAVPATRDQTPLGNDGCQSLVPEGQWQLQVRGQRCGICPHLFRLRTLLAGHRARNTHDETDRSSHDAELVADRDANAVRSDIQTHQPLDRHHSAFTSILPAPGKVLSNSAGLTVMSTTSTPSIIPIACRASGWDLPLAAFLIWSIRSGL